MRISKYIKAATIWIDFDAQVEEDLQHTQAAEAARASRMITTQRRVLGGGVISVEEARRRIRDRAEEETSEDNRSSYKRQKRSKEAVESVKAFAARRSK